MTWSDTKHSFTEAIETGIKLVLNLLYWVLFMKYLHFSVPFSLDIKPEREKEGGTAGKGGEAGGAVSETRC